jgi:hypothetical protein
VQFRTFDADDFGLQLNLYIAAAVHSFMVTEIAVAAQRREDSVIPENEMRRLVHLQIPAFFRSAHVQRSIDRVRILRDSVEKVEPRTNTVWARVLEQRFQELGTVPVASARPPQDRVNRLFQNIARECESAVRQNDSTSGLLTPESFAAWDLVGGALVYSYQSAIALLSGLPGDRLW